MLNQVSNALWVLHWAHNVYMLVKLNFWLFHCCCVLIADGAFKVWVKTSVRVQQHENADLHVVRLMLFGSKAVSPPLDLKNKDKDMFTAGKRDEFDVSCNRLVCMRYSVFNIEINAEFVFN